jgi:hypothetical protein
MQFPRKLKPLLPAVLLLAVIGIIAPFAVHAGPVQWIQDAVLWAMVNILEAAMSLVGKITLQLISILTTVAAYNKFGSSPAIATGWVMVRDVANMFFVVMLMVIAIGTIVGSEKYTYQKNLFRILAAALFINFSKTIALLFIDLSQVIMLTFVNGFKLAAAGNFTKALGIDKLTGFEFGDSAANQGKGSINFTDTLGSVMFGLIMLVIMTTVIGVLVLSLVLRIVYLWFLVITAPFAFLLTAFPTTKTKADEWWSELVKQLTTGPILAFFLWLSLVSLQKAQIETPTTSSEKATIRNPVKSAATLAGTEENMMKFIVSCVMLVGGLVVAQRVGGTGAGIAGAALGLGKKGLTVAGKWAGKRLAPIAIGAALGGPVGALVGAGLATQRGRIGVGRVLASGPMGYIPGARKLGLAMQSSAAKQFGKQEDDAEKAMKGSTPQQQLRVALSRKASLQMNYAAGKSVRRNKAQWSTMGRSAEGRAQQDAIKKMLDRTSKIYQDKDGQKLAGLEHHEAAAAKDSKPAKWNEEKFGAPYPDPPPPNILPEAACLVAGTLISAAGGLVKVEDLRTGILIWSVTRTGEKVLVPVLKVDAGRIFETYQVKLYDGRSVTATNDHPTADGRLFRDLVIGQPYDGSFIKGIVCRSSDCTSYDLQPDGETAYYWANGILIGSTFVPPRRDVRLMAHVGVTIGGQPWL